MIGLDIKILGVKNNEAGSFVTVPKETPKCKPQSRKQVRYWGSEKQLLVATSPYLLASGLWHPGEVRWRETPLLEKGVLYAKEVCHNLPIRQQLLIIRYYGLTLENMIFKVQKFPNKCLTNFKLYTHLVKSRFLFSILEKRGWLGFCISNKYLCVTVIKGSHF